ncbi:MAG: hypothetical protein JWO03_467 [Bacteroidetes bacterium]|nr:hypothetical protein [Bacteroidota bacterium]
MKLQVIEDGKGKATGVFIPINDWNKLKKQIKSQVKIEYQEPTKEKLIKELKQAAKEIALIKKGKLKARPATELLNEL